MTAKAIITSIKVNPLICRPRTGSFGASGMPAQSACTGSHLQEILEQDSSFHPGVFATWVKWPITLEVAACERPLKPRR